MLTIGFATGQTIHQPTIARYLYMFVMQSTNRALPIYYILCIIYYMLGLGHLEGALQHVKHHGLLLLVFRPNGIEHLVCCRILCVLLSLSLLHFVCVVVVILSRHPRASLTSVLLPCSPHARAHLVLPSLFPRPRAPLVLPSRSCSPRARAHLSLISRSSRAHLVLVLSSGSCFPRAPFTLVLPC